jgi:hypothetical protein
VLVNAEDAFEQLPARLHFLAELFAFGLLLASIAATRTSV